MATLSTPTQQAGILSFYDAPERGPLLNPKLVLIAVFVFGIIVLLLDHFLF
ncbi:MAG: preprotein translocase subunit Sec61beta [Candidatus Micrarchaeaceae archaeon]